MITGFSVLANNQTAIHHHTNRSGRADSIHRQQNQYMAELQEPLPSDVQPLIVWQQRRSVYNKVAPIAENLIIGMCRENIFTYFHSSACCR